MLAYAGVGSRDTPAEVLAQMAQFARDLGDDGWTLRSGAAGGADAAFEGGLLDWHAREIFLPKNRFNGHASPLGPTPAAFVMAAEFHPAWDRCNPFARALHARNCHQVLGQDLDDPVEMVVCWTLNGRGAGGTGQALRLAKAQGIQIFDMGLGGHVLDDARQHAELVRAALRPAA